MKKVVVVAQGLGNGGSERVASTLANMFSENGYEVMHISVAHSRVEYKLNQNIKAVNVSQNYKNKFVKQVKINAHVYKEIINFHADVVISFLICETMLNTLISHIPTVFTLRIDPRREYKSIIKRGMRYVSYLLGKKIVFQTNDARDYFPDKIKQKGVVIGNPITDSLPYWKDNAHEKTVLTACRLEKQKNIPLLIEAFEMFHEQHKDYKLVICGRGTEESKLRHICREKGLEDFVLFLGFRSDVHDQMARARMFVLSSDYEGLSNSMLEALAIGVPTISTDSPPGGAAEYMHNRENGFLTEVGNAKQLCQSMCMLANDDELCQEFSENSVKIRKRLSQSVVFQQWEDVIKDV